MSHLASQNPHHPVLVAGNHALDLAASGSSSGSVAIDRRQQIIFIRPDSPLCLGLRKARHLRR
jgi:hypothetical protein